MSRIGVCSWSLRPKGPEDLADKIAELDLAHVQLALDPLREGEWSVHATRRALAQHGITAVSGMMGTRGEDYSTLASIRRTGGVRSDVHWSANLAAARVNARLARELGLSLVTLHAGFLPEDQRDPERAKLIIRLRSIAGVFADQGLRLGFETGQESADTLLTVLREIDRSNVGVNFDPANMILYGMGEPVAAFAALGAYVLQVHVKDALPTARADEWGSEVPSGTGAVDWPRFFDVLGTLGRPIDLMIEREAGDDRSADIQVARELVERELARIR